MIYAALQRFLRVCQKGKRPAIVLSRPSTPEHRPAKSQRCPAG